MAKFDKAYEITLQNEGSYVNDPDDSGGETYKGIARNSNSKWPGWVKVDMLKKLSGFPESLDKDPELQAWIKMLYQVKYWDTILGDDITNQEVANSIYDFGVNAGVQTSSILAQTVAEVKADGVIGTESIKALNSIDPKYFIAAFTVAKIARYVYISKKKPSNRKYFYGWVCRTLGETN